MRSHKTLEAPGYATYESRGRQGYWRIAEFGQHVLTQSSDLVKVALEPGFKSSIVEQALRRVNYTNPSSIPGVLVFDEDEVIKEGARTHVRRAVYERSRRLRDAAITHYTEEGELKCEVCEFSFERTYGELGRGFIEIHHKTPIFCLQGQSVEQTIARAMRDVAALCANCHRMVHRQRDVILSVEELRVALDRERRDQEELSRGEREDAAVTATTCRKV